MKKLIFLILSFFCTIGIFAQNVETVRINVIIPQPHTDRLSYYGEPGRMIVRITNLTNTEQNVYLRGKIEGIDNDRLIYTDPNFRPDDSYTITVPAGKGQTVLVPSGFIQDVYYTDNVVFAGTSAEKIQRDGRLGEGCYNVCLTAWNIQNYTQRLSSDQTGCNMICVRNIEAPILIRPTEDEILSTPQIQNVIFSWNRPVGTPANVQYKLKIVEMFDHARNPNDAYLSATSPAFFEEEVMNNVYIYGPEAPPLVEGRKYAWAVTAIDPTGESTFQNGGRSEVHAFVYGQIRIGSPEILTPDNNSSVASGIQQSLNISWRTVAEAPANTQYRIRLVELPGQSQNTTDAIRELASDGVPLFETTVNGNHLDYSNDHPKLTTGKEYALQVTAIDPDGKAQFENEGKSQPVIFRYGQKPVDVMVASKKDTLPKVDTQISGRLLYRFADDDQGHTFPVVNQQVFLRKIFVQRVVNKDGVESYVPVQSIVNSGSNMLDGVSVETDADGYFILTCGMSVLDSAGIIPESNWNYYMHNPMTKPAYDDQIALFYQIETSNPHYKPSQEYLRIIPGASRDLSDVVLEANSFTLAVNVQEVFNQLKGNYVEGANIKVYRDAYNKNDARFGIPAYEGDLLSSAALAAAQKDEKVLIAERTTPAGSNPTKPEDFYVYFKNLFREQNATPYHYRIVLEKGATVVTELSYEMTSNQLSVANKEKVNLGATQEVITGVTQTKNTATEPTLNKPGLSGLLAKGATMQIELNPEAPNSISAVQLSNANKTKDKWISYHYNSKPDTAFLTLEKELISPPRSKVTGKLEYAYKDDKSLPATPYANMPVKLMVVYLWNTNSSSNNTLSNGGSVLNLNGFYGLQTLINANMDDYQQFKPVIGQDDPLKIEGKSINDNYKVLQTVMTDDQGNFEFDFPNSDLTGKSQSGTLWEGTTGDLRSTSRGKVMRVYRIVPDIPYYCAPDNNVIVQPWKDTDIGTLTSFVQTFNLKVLTQKIDKAELPTTLDKFTNVPVNLYRAASSPMAKYWPVMRSIDLNQLVQLFDAPSSGVASQNAPNTGVPKRAGQAANNSSVFTSHAGQTYSGQYITSSKILGNQTNNVDYHVGNIPNASSSSIQSVSTIPQNLLQNSYIKFRNGASDENGEIIFPNIVKSMGREDIILLEADNNDRLNTTNFGQAYLEFPTNVTVSHSGGEVSTSTKNLRTEAENLIFTNTGMINASGPEDYNFRTAGIVQKGDQNMPIFNSQFDPDETVTAYLRVLPGGTLVQGRVTDQFTGLGVKGIGLRLDVVIEGYLLTETVFTDENGYYKFSSTEYNLSRYKEPKDFNLIQLKTGKKFGSSYSNLNVLYASGYEKVEEADLGVINLGRTGLQIVRNFAINPIGRGAYGYVVDADDTNIGVKARVMAKSSIQGEANGKWVDTKVHIGALEQPSNTISNYMESSGMFMASLNAAVIQNELLAATSNSKNASTPLGFLGTLNTTIAGGKAETTLAVNSENTNSQHPIVKAGENKAADNSGFKVTGTTNLPKTTTAQSLLTTTSQRFEYDLPAKQDYLIIMPYDRAYMPDTVAVYAKEPNEYLGQFKLRKRKHHLQIIVKTKDGVLVKNAQVTVDEADGQIAYTDSHGMAEFEFVNNTQTNFTVRVKNNPQVYSENGLIKRDLMQRPLITPPNQPGDAEIILIVPRTVTNLHCNDDLKVYSHTIEVERAIELKGTVTFEGSTEPVEGALVFVDQGKGSDSDIRAITDSVGTYSLALPIPKEILTNIPLLDSFFSSFTNINITASYAADGKTYVGSTKKFTKAEAQSTSPRVDLTIREVDNIDISSLYGFRVRIKSLTETNDGNYRISGELFNTTSNENFALSSQTDGDKVLAFTHLDVRASSSINSSGVPLATPVSDQITLLNREINIRTFKVFNAKLIAADEGKTLTIEKSGGVDKGVLAGNVRIEDNSFYFPTSYMTISKQDFYLGQFGSGSGSAKLKIPVFRTDKEYPLTKFSITSTDGKPINFEYLGFKGVSETAGDRESYVQDDKINLFMNLKAKIQGGITLDLPAGKAVIQHDRIDPFVTDKEIRFKLEKWEVHAKSWELSTKSGGIVFKDNTLYTGRADLHFNNITVTTTNELLFEDGNVNTAELTKNLTLGGKAKIPLKVYGGTEVKFIYDPDVGRIPGEGHFKFTLSNTTGKAAYIEKLEGMTGTNDRIVIQYLSILSNDEEVFGFEPNAPPVTYLNQISFTPGNIYSNFDRLIISGTVNLHIPNVPTLYSEFAYWPQDNNVNKLIIKPLEFTFTGNGGSTFKSYALEDAQVFHSKGIGIAGQVKLPGQSNWLETQLLSVVTSGYNQAASVVKKQTEVIIGHYKEEAKNMAAELVDEVLNTPELKALRSQIEGKLNEVYETINQNLPMGNDGQIIKNLAGQWRLVGQGQDVVNNLVDGNPIGAMMQLNGLIDGAVGINIKDEAKNKAKMVAMEAVKGIQDEIPVEALAEGGMKGSSGKPGMQFDFDFAKGRVTGSLSVPKIETGAVTLKDLGIELLFDNNGWYFYTGASVNVRGVPLIFPVATGMLIGNYSVISPALESRVTAVSYVKKLPKTYKTNGIKGFFLVGRKDILEEVKFGVNFYVADFEVGAGAGLDARLYANFGENNQEIGIGAMVFAHAYAKLLLIGGVCGVSGSTNAELGAKATFTNNSGNPSFSIAACASANINVAAWCTVVAGSIDVGFQAIIKLCAGSCNKSIDWDLRMTNEKCSEGNDFDY